MKSKINSLIGVLTFFSMVGGFLAIAPEAKAGCGWGDITCNPNNWTCPPGGCNQTRPTESRIPVEPPRVNQYRIRYNNASGQTISQLYVSPTSDDGWGGDLLGSGVLRNNWYFDINFDDRRGCMYDLKAVLANGRESRLMNFNACTIGTVNIR